MEPFALVTRIMEVLSDVRLHTTLSENEIHENISLRLTTAAIKYKHEAPIAPRCRVDFLCDEGVAIEVKRGKQNYKRVADQIDRYCASDQVKALILVTERGLIDTLEESHGKPVYTLKLSNNWGIAL